MIGKALKKYFRLFFGSSTFIPHEKLMASDLCRFKYNQYGKVLNMKEESTIKLMIAIIFGVDILCNRVLNNGSL